jgi:hypothetical protein
MGDFLIAAHYETENYAPPKIQFLEDAEYGRALDTIVKGNFAVFTVEVVGAIFLQNLFIRDDSLSQQF